LSSFRSCIIEFENLESALAAKQDLDQIPDISVSLRRKKSKAGPENIARQREEKLRKMKIVEKNAEISDEAVYGESSLYVSFPNQKRPLPDVIRKLHPKIIDVKLLNSKGAK
jgi:hypothetical protein